MKYFVLVVIAFLSFSSIIGQNNFSQIDSLLANYEEEYSENKEAAFLNLSRALELSNELDYKKGQSEAYYYMAKADSDIEEYDAAIEKFKKALSISPESKINTRILSSLGTSYYYKGNYPKAIDYQLKGLEISEENNDTICYRVIF